MASSSAFDGLIDAAAARWSSRIGYTIPPPVVKGIVARESAFDPRAFRREPDGRISRGLTQVLEGTARELGLANPLELYTPATAIDVGTHYLANQLKRYRGDMLKAVAAYNAGTARVAAGRFSNQAYVDAVVKFARSFGWAPVAGGAALLLAAGVAALLLFRRRGSTR